MIKAVFFDLDGVIIDTERDGHRVAFNKTFQEFGFNVHWNIETYHELLQVAGGKERMRYFLRTEGFGRPIPPEKEDGLIKSLHKRKTEIFIELLRSGSLPLRPGVRRLMREINNSGLKLAICTTSNELAANTVADTILADIRFDFILAGDMVRKKKPDPEIYNLAAGKSGSDPGESLVFEDSRNGVEAAKAAGMYVVATTNPYTEREDLTRADLIVSSLGDPKEEKGYVQPDHNGSVRLAQAMEYDGVLSLGRLKEVFL